MSVPVLELLPAVDISEGYAVRPVGGTLSGGEQRLDPVEAALTWVKAGARWIHLVDLDLAFGRGTNTEVLAEVVAAVRAENARMAGSAPVRIQVSGGVRNAESLERALSLNPDRVNVTSA
ncbi:HisA/HisF-related TIM barrel protein, partial [Rothia mucilaginosa]